MDIIPIGMGKSYYVGRSSEESIKLDLFYTDPFIDDVQDFQGIRLASRAEIVAMKLDVVQRTGRKKDFWDIDQLSDDFTIEEMFALHEKRYPYTHDREQSCEVRLRVHLLRHSKGQHLLLVPHRHCPQ